MAAPVDPRLLRRSAAVRRSLAVSVGLGVLTTALLLVQARAVAGVVSDAFVGQALTGAAVAVGACLALRAVVEWLHAAASARAAAGLVARLRRDLLDVVLDPRRSGALPPTSRLATLVDRGLDPLEGYVGRFLPQLVLAVVAPVAVVGVLVVVDPWSALVVVLTLPLVVGFLVLVGLATQDRTDQRWAELARLGQHFAEVLRGLPLFAVLGRDQEEGLRAVGEQHRRETMRALRMAFTSALVLELFSTLSVALVAVSIGLRVVHGDLTLETGLFALLVAPEAYLPIRRLSTQYHDATAGVDAAREALDLLESPSATGRVVPASRPTITLTGLTVAYPGRDVPALRVEHETIRAGETVAVTGPSGCGKSTLLAVLLGFVRPTSGHVRIAGTDLAELDLEAWRRSIAWVPQVPAVLSGTVGENVRLGAPRAAEADVRWALRAAGADDLDPARACGEGGALLSSGERRRLAVARALLRVRCAGASLLLVDEPTAGLDAERERAVLDAIAGLDVTCVLVAHRPEAVQAADRQVRLVVPAMVPA